jgi:hypothetical protein
VGKPNLDIPVIRPPRNASPAPVVSVTLVTLLASTLTILAGVAKILPLPPSVIATSLHDPHHSIRLAAALVKSPSL